MCEIVADLKDGKEVDYEELKSPRQIPGTDEWKKFHNMCSNIYNKVVGNE